MKVVGVELACFGDLESPEEVSAVGEIIARRLLLFFGDSLEREQELEDASVAPIEAAAASPEVVEAKTGALQTDASASESPAAASQFRRSFIEKNIEG